MPFWPMRASSANQIVYVLRRDVLFAGDFVQARGGGFFKILDRPFGLSMMTRKGGRADDIPRPETRG